ncbi:hypothetical protein Adeg_0835 [Ammonifex degensii KC4]|uniref:Uncharacterized protein n=1 Tax=Ammonifex degensii (strain DSM 10501 / KC4) TaxID=429009 RepID=C9RCJ8_AMMDK|nr:hypothetical protein [Ammonifex degensii]ACX51975.1 hypothetical protein Adeg_0835 [Ammonifex degensii KC4]
MVLRCKRQLAGWEFVAEKGENVEVKRRAGEEVRPTPSSPKGTGQELLLFLLLLELVLALAHSRPSPREDPAQSETRTVTLVLGSGSSGLRECLRNGSFESWKEGRPLYWEGENIAFTPSAHSGSGAVVLGEDPSKEALLWQDFPVVAGRRLDFRFTARFSLGMPVVRGRVEWLDREKRPVGLGTEVVLPATLPADYRPYWRLTGGVPEKAVWGRVCFVKEGYGTAEVDDVSLVG